MRCLLAELLENAAGPDFVSRLKTRGYKIFLDLKMHDIPNTVKGGAESVAKLGVDVFNVHAAGGRQMMESAMAIFRRVVASARFVFSGAFLFMGSRAVLAFASGTAE